MLFQERQRDNVFLTVHRLASPQGAGCILIFRSMSLSIDSIPASSAAKLYCISSFMLFYMQTAHHTHPHYGNVRRELYLLAIRGQKTCSSVPLKAGYMHGWCWYSTTGKKGSLVQLGCLAACGRAKC